MEFNLIYVLPTPPGGILGIKRLDLCFFGLFHKISIILSLRVATTPNKHSISVGITHGTDNMGGANLCHLLCRLKWSIKERSKNIKKKKESFFFVVVAVVTCCYASRAEYQRLDWVYSGQPKLKIWRRVSSKIRLGGRSLFWHCCGVRCRIRWRLQGRWKCTCNTLERLTWSWFCAWPSKVETLCRWHSADTIEFHSRSITPPGPRAPEWSHSSHLPVRNCP